MCERTLWILLRPRARSGLWPIFEWVVCFLITEFGEFLTYCGDRSCTRCVPHRGVLLREGRLVLLTTSLAGLAFFVFPP